MMIVKQQVYSDYRYRIISINQDNMNELVIASKIKSKIECRMK